MSVAEVDEDAVGVCGVEPEGCLEAVGGFNRDFGLGLRSLPASLLVEDHLADGLADGGGSLSVESVGGVGDGRGVAVEEHHGEGAGGGVGAGH